MNWDDVGDVFVVVAVFFAVIVVLIVTSGLGWQ